jgi:acetyltransferase-like isoleucine patch superfamily enzyme
MDIQQIIKQHPFLKKLVHYLLIPKGQARPRTWVKIIINPFFHKKDKSSIIRRSTRMDVLPFQEFTLGAHSIIEDFATINNGVGPVHIGNQTFIGIGNVIIGPVAIGHNIIFAQNIVVSGLNHEYSDVSMPISKQVVNTKLIEIGDDSWIGANAVITAGSKIGKHCVIGAGAVVTGIIPDYSIAVGNPARIIKKYNTLTHTWEKC